MTMTINQYNRKLEAFYLNYFTSNEIIDSSNLDKLSVPMLLKVNENYFDPKKPTIFIFGQETKYWGEEPYNTYFSIRDSSGKTIKYIMEHYEYKLKEKKSKSPLLTLNRDIKDKLGFKYNVLWNNLYKYSYEGERISKYVSKEHFKNIMKHQKVFMQFELELFQPQGMIFLTGKGLDTELEYNFNCHIERLKSYGDYCSQLKITSDFNIDKEIQTFRTPHPGWCKWGKISKDEIIKYIVQFFSSAKAPTLKQIYK